MSIGLGDFLIYALAFLLFISAIFPSKGLQTASLAVLLILPGLKLLIFLVKSIKKRDYLISAISIFVLFVMLIALIFVKH